MRYQRKLEDGLLRICPLCGDPLTNSEMAVKSHLVMHVNKGDIKESERSDLKLKILGQERKYPK